MNIYELISIIHDVRIRVPIALHVFCILIVLLRVPIALLVLVLEICKVNIYRGALGSSIESAELHMAAS